MTDQLIFDVHEKIATIRLNRPDKYNAFTAEMLEAWAASLREASTRQDVDVIVVTGTGKGFCSGGDVHDIIGPLVGMDMKGLLAFTRMTGDLVKAMIGCGKPIISAVDGVCVGAGAIIAMASDLRVATPEAKCAFLFTRVGLAGCDMGACAMLPRIIGQGRAADLLYTGRVMSAAEGERWGFWNALHDAGALDAEAMKLAGRIAAACRAQLADFKCPHEVRLVTELPRSTLEKIAKAELRRQLAAEGTPGG